MWNEQFKEISKVYFGSFLAKNPNSRYSIESTIISIIIPGIRVNQLVRFLLSRYVVYINGFLLSIRETNLHGKTY
jgi:hypothetical protein